MALDPRSRNFVNFAGKNVNDDFSIPLKKCRFRNIAKLMVLQSIFKFIRSNENHDEIARLS